MAEAGSPALRLVPDQALGIVKVRLWGDEADARLAAALPAVPAPRRLIAIGPGASCAWLAPGEWLLTAPEADLGDWLDRLEAALGSALALVTDLSVAQIGFRLSGPAARERLAAGCPLDLRDHAFPVDRVARSLFGEVGLFVARLPDEGGGACFRLVVERTRADYLARLIVPR